VTPPDLAFRAFLEEGRFMLQRSRETGCFVFYPRVAEPGTGCTDLEWTEASGAGVVYSTTVVRNQPRAPDYNVALIDLAEGVRMMSSVEGIEPGAVTIGLAVRARIARIDEAPVIVFDPA
jgi:uncharacterized OB-fold protein